MSRKGMFTRYKFFKKLYPRSLVIIKSNDKYKSFRKDGVLLDYIIDNFNLNKISKFKINYIILENLDIIEEKEFVDNNYYKFIKVAYLNKVLIEIKYRLK